MSKEQRILRGKMDKHIDKNKGTGENIRYLREQNEMTQQELANKVFLNVKKIGRFEKHGIKEATIEELEEICEQLQISLPALYIGSSIKEANCNELTGLSENTIQWLQVLNYNGHEFIDLLNDLPKNKHLFNLVCSITKEIKDTLNRMDKED